MKALSYLLRTRMKNSLRELLHNPRRLILVILLIIAMAASLLPRIMYTPDVTAFRPGAELSAIVFAFYLLIAVTVSLSGLRSGATFYTMADVNLLFNAPISPRRILIYGLVRQLGATLMMGLVLIFQYAWISSTYQVSLPQFCAVLAGYALTVFCSQLVAMAIYSFSSHSEKRRRLIRILLYLLIGAVLLAAAVPTLRAEDLLTAAVTSVNRPLFDWFPIVGWLRAFTMGVIGSEPLRALAGLGGIAAFIVLFTVVLLKTDADYYEDVLSATEVSFSAVTAKKEGRMEEAVPQNVKTGRTGIGHGRGASVFFYKHLLENRRGRVFLFDSRTLIFMAATLVTAFFTRQTGILPAFAMSSYMMLFSSFMGRWARELQQPYIYLVPQKASKKLLAICGEHILKSAAESAVIMAAAGLLVGADVGEILACIAARSALALLFIAGTVLAERLFGSLPGRVLQTFLCIFTLLVVGLPGIVAGAVAGSLLGLAAGVLIFGAWALLAGLLLLFLCRNMLNYAEMNNK